MPIGNEYAFVTPMRDLEAVRRQEKELTVNGGAYASMTAFERETKTAKLQEARDYLRPKILSALAYDWQQAKTDNYTLKVAKSAAAAKAARQWDFGRLAYDRTRAHDLLAQARGVDEMGKQWEQVSIDGDRSLMRAYAEETIKHLATANLAGTDKMKAADLRGRLNKSLDEMTVTDEQRALAEEGRQLTQKIALLEEQTKRARQEYFSANPLASNLVTPFDDLLRGVQVTRRVDPTNLAMTTEVDLDW